ncbi:MAG: peptidoglycan-binding domain-containing protein [Acidobacteriaceae bacterium]
MKLRRGILTRIAMAACVLALLTPTSWAASPGTHSKKSVSKSSSKHPKTARSSKLSSKKSRHRSRKPRGQQAIDSGRTREIQEALITQHYLQGEPTGSWDAQTKAALVKFQHDNGWQTKVVPDSRALIKLGLGPSHDGLLNPESAAISSPRELGMAKEIPGGGEPQHK